MPPYNYTSALMEISRFEGPLNKLSRKPGEAVVEYINVAESAAYVFTDYIAITTNCVLVLAYDKKNHREAAIKVGLPQKAQWEIAKYFGSRVRHIRDAVNYFKREKLKLEKRPPGAMRLIESAKAQQIVHRALLEKNYYKGYVPAVYQISGKIEMPYFAMEYIEGVDALAWSKDKTDLQKLELLLSLVGVCEIMHRKGIVNCDIKPANVLVRPNDTPVLIDFDIFKNVNAKKQLNITMKGEELGTKIVRPPEMSTDARLRDWKADIFELGRFLWLIWNEKMPDTDGIIDFETCTIADLYPASVFADSEVRSIFVNATAVSADNRYPVVAEMKEAILAVIEKYREKKEIEIIDYCKTCRNKDICGEFKLCALKIKALRALRKEGYL